MTIYLLYCSSRALIIVTQPIAHSLCFPLYINWKLFCSEHPKWSFIKPHEFRQKFLNGTLETFDAIFTYSSIEHSGLGMMTNSMWDTGPQSVEFILRNWEHTVFPKILVLTLLHKHVFPWFPSYCGPEYEHVNLLNYNILIGWQLYVFILLFCAR